MLILEPDSCVQTCLTALVQSGRNRDVWGSRTRELCGGNRVKICLGKLWNWSPVMNLSHPPFGRLLRDEFWSPLPHPELCASGRGSEPLSTTGGRCELQPDTILHPALAWIGIHKILMDPQDCLIFPAVLLIFAVFRYKYFMWLKNQNERIILRNGFKKMVKICYTYYDKQRENNLFVITLNSLTTILVELCKFISSSSVA